jgi:PAS domain-containing protein
MSNEYQWVKEFPGAVTVTDARGTILAMNERAIRAFKEDGGEALIGTNVLDCHPEPARTRLKELLATQERNVYTIEKKGVKKLIYQSPWFRGGSYAGMVELSLEIPPVMPHFIREG